jgi:hypothetical protein
VANGQPTCVSSKCSYSCNSGYTPCNGQCVNEQTDRNNCGGCGTTSACLNGLSCVKGACSCVPSGCPACTVLLGSPCCTGGACGCTGTLGLGCTKN